MLLVYKKKVPLELVVSVGTGGKDASPTTYFSPICGSLVIIIILVAYTEVKVPPRVGWDGVVAQILDSATEGEWLIFDIFKGRGFETFG